ncbi:aminoacyl-tRNA hydrolase [Geitlerinema splendidum]|nr:aminoacyl-tRNA hydrolase [Geitlerinema splendidum]
MVVGLGNPGARYAGTRHNVGFDLVDELGKRHGQSLRTTRDQALIAEVTINGVETVLVKPLTFMNLSGRAVKALAARYSISPKDILVVADDLDLPTGKVKMKPKGGAGGHNGHKSLLQLLGTDEYPRIKIGIGKAGETVDHVLSRFTPEERVDIESAIKLSADAAELWLTDGIERAMNHANSLS